MSTMPQETRTSMVESTTPTMVAALRRRARPRPRMAASQRTGSRPSGGMTRSRRLRPPWPGGIGPRIAAAGLIRLAWRAGSAAATIPVRIPVSSPTAIVDGRTSTTSAGMSSMPV